MNISVVIPCYNSSQTLERALKKYFSTNYSAFDNHLWWMTTPGLDRDRESHCKLNNLNYDY